MAPKKTQETSTDLSNLLTTKEMKDIKTVEDIVSRFGGKVVSIVDVQPDFSLVDSMELVGVSFLVAHAEKRFSDDFAKYDAEGILQPGAYYSVYVITDDNRRLVFNDGGTGIVPALDHFIEISNQTGGLKCPWGLRASTYDAIVDGQKIKATTMYFATSKPKNK